MYLLSSYWLKICEPESADSVWCAGKPRRGMLRRAVFSDFQRKGLEKRFQLQKYISKPDRKKLAEKLGLKDSQVWAGKRIFQVLGGWDSCHNIISFAHYL